MSNNTMKAVVIEKYGGVEVLQQKELPKPTVTEPHDLLVRINAAAVNPVDTKIRVNFHGDLNQPLRVSPLILGYDACGVVEQVGSAVTDFKVGDEVYYAGSMLRQGSYAQYQLVDSRLVGKKPKSLNHLQAAAVPLTALTAWELLHERMGLQPGDNNNKDKSVLIINGAGGVGSIAIQMCKNLLGLSAVIATASRAKSKAWCKKMGADFVVDHKQNIGEQLKEIGHPLVDYILILCNTEDYFEACADWIKPFGRIGLIVETDKKFNITGKSVTEGFMGKCVSFHWELMFSRSLFGVGMEIQGAYLNYLAECFDQKKLQPYDDATFEFDQIRDAHTLQESGAATGKIVIKVSH